MKQGYKESELGIIPVDWEVKRISDIAKTFSGGTPKSDIKKYYDGDIPFIKSGEIHKNKTEQYLTIEGVENSSAKIIEVGDILYALYGANSGDVAISKIKGAINQAILCIRTTQNSFFMRENLFFLYNIIVNKYLQGGQGNLSADIIKKIKISLPTLPEQKAIADCLTTWDKAIESQLLLVKAKETRKKALIQQLLTGKKRLPGFTEEWKEVKLGDLFERVVRKNKEGNLNVITISAQKGFVRQTDYFNKSVASSILDNYYLVHKGEFCYNKSYSNGYPWGATKRLKDFDKAVVTTLYICFKIKNEQVSSGDFFEHFFQANLLNKGLTQIAYEGGRAHGLLNVSSIDFFCLKFQVPSFEEQNAIAAILNTTEKEIQIEKQKLVALQEQKKGIMQQLLTGKVRLIQSA